LQVTTKSDGLSAGETLPRHHDDNQFALIYLALAAGAAFAMYIFLTRLTF